MSLYRPGIGGTGGIPEDIAVTGEAIPPGDDARRRPVVVGGGGGCVCFGASRSFLTGGFESGAVVRLGGMGSSPQAAMNRSSVARVSFFIAVS